MTGKTTAQLTQRRCDGFERIAYIFQGGGALGAFQLGAYQALVESGYRTDWMCGISIGAINSAIIAGNRFENRLPRLREFWQQVAVHTLLPDLYTQFGLNKLHNMFAAQWALSNGINAFFKPNTFNPWLIQNDTPDHISFYDTTPLRETLLSLIDFDFLNRAEVRLSLGAVNVTTGALVFFDNTKQHLTVDHILASGALPPGFPAVRIGDNYYWDGGIYSNSPISLVLDDPADKNTLCFMVDVFSAHGVLPHSLDGILEREKDIRFSSRSRRQQNKHTSQYNLRNAINKIGSKLTPEQKNDPEIKKLLSLGGSYALHIAHIIYHSPTGTELQSKDYEFSQASINRRIETGYQQTLALIAEKRDDWMKHMSDGEVVFYHEDEEDLHFAT